MVSESDPLQISKHTITELDRSKIEEQKKAVRSGYDMDIIPSDLATSLGKIERGIKGFSIDLLIEIAVFFDASLDYIVLGREMQIDVTKQALGSIINQLVDLEKKL